MSAILDALDMLADDLVVPGVHGMPDNGAPEGAHVPMLTVNSRIINEDAGGGPSEVGRVGRTRRVLEADDLHIVGP
eukprot:gene29488-5835_t